MAQAFSCEFCKISKNTFLCRTPLVAASALYFTSGYFSFTYQLMTCFYILNMSVDVNTWHAVTGLFVNTTQQFAVFHLCLF